MAAPVPGCDWSQGAVSGLVLVFCFSGADLCAPWVAVGRAFGRGSGLAGWDLRILWRGGGACGGGSCGRMSGRILARLKEYE
jgi:hypothetical protein